MGAPPYTEDQKQAALGALMASAVLVQGEWVPNFDAVAREVGISHQTLRRWWRERDVAGDVGLRGAVSRGAAAVQQEGAADWYRAKLEGGRALVDHLLAPETYKGLDGDKAARLFHLTMQGLRDLGAQLEGSGTTKGGGKMERLQRLQKKWGEVR
jgi:transposase-like protein